MTILEEIIASKEHEVRLRAAEVPLAVLPPRPDPVRDFKGAIGRAGLQVIAEVKRRSPSMGAINLNIDPVDLARAYEHGGAAAISVLTDETYFGGHLKHLQAIRDAVTLPVLRKDFIITEYQVHESYHAGADAILLIADTLTAADLNNLHRLAVSLGLHVLVEGHSDHSLAQIRNLSPEVAGINSRDLTTMQIDLSAMIARFDHLPASSLVVAESGITSPAELARVAQAGFDAALIGTALLASGKPESNLRRFLAGLPTEGAA